MSKPKVEFLFDYGSPNAFLAREVLPSIEARTGVKLEYVPILLGGIYKATGNQSPYVTYGNIKSRMAYDLLEIERFVAKHEIKGYRHNEHFPLNTLMLMRGAVAAQMLGIFEPYSKAIWNAVWRTGRKLDEIDILTTTLKEANLPAETILAAAQDAQNKQRLLMNTEQAVARGAFGAPTFFVNDDIYFGKDRLREVEEAIVASQQ